jgi:phosphoglycerate dehydrogenase-like enzyme
MANAAKTPGEPRVLVVLGAAEHPAPPGLDDVAPGLEVRLAQADTLGDALPGADALLMWDFFSDALAPVWSRADRLSWIHVAAAGVDTLLFDELVASDVLVTNAQGVFDVPIAEYVLASILAFTKDLHGSWELQRSHQWRHRETLRLAGRRVLVVGTGGIGRATGRLLRAAGMVVRGAGRVARTDDPDFGDVVASADLARAVTGTDHLVLAAPLTAQTRGLVDAQVLAALPASAQVINSGRGPLLDEDALLAALREGRLAGAALDVFAVEPLPPDHPLWSAPGVVVSAHMSGDVVGWRDDLAAQFFDNLRRWRDGEELRNRVDKVKGYVASAPLAASR